MNSVKTVLFTNFSDTAFTHTWNTVPYTFQPGVTIMVEDWKADHFAKHLIDRELTKAKIVTSNLVERDKMYVRCVAVTDAPPMEQSQADTELLNRNAITNEVKPKQGMDCCGSMGTRHKKECPTNRTPEEATEFADLNN